MEAAAHTGSRTGASDRLATAIRVVGLVLGIGYVMSGVVGALAGVSEEGSDLVWWLLLLLGGGALVLVGTFGLASRPVVSAVLVVVGAAAGALALVWSVIAPVLAVELAVLVILRAGRARA